MDWRKSRFSGSGGNCVEVRQDLAAIRDSKNPDGATLAVDLPRLLVAVKSWRKSSFSGAGGDCVEVRRDLAAVRDSKNPDGPTLAVDLPRFLAAVRSDDLD
jgi:hypothetical protein